LRDLVEYLNTRISFYLGSREIIKDCDELFVCREDGVLLFKELVESSRADRLGALVAGMWQAAKSIQENSSELRERGFTLQFSTSREGIIVFPLNIEEQSLVLSIAFQDELHPGRLKNRCRLLRDALENDFSEFRIKNRSQVKQSNKDFLFTNISDQEIDNLFSVAGI
jgi:hypothetical protein